MIASTKTGISPHRDNSERRFLKYTERTIAHELTMTGKTRCKSW